MLLITGQQEEAISLAGRNVEKLYINHADAIKVRAHREYGSSVLSPRHVLVS